MQQDLVSGIPYDISQCMISLMLLIRNMMRIFIITSKQNKISSICNKSYKIDSIDNNLRMMTRMCQRCGIYQP